MNPISLVDDVCALRRTRFEKFKRLVDRIACGRPQSGDTPEAVDALLRETGVSVERLELWIEQGVSADAEPPDDTELQRQFAARRIKLNGEQGRLINTLPKAQQRLNSARLTLAAFENDEPSALLGHQRLSELPEPQHAGPMRFAEGAVAKAEEEVAGVSGRMDEIKADLGAMDKRLAQMKAAGAAT